ncbi:MAG: hypothetical protein M0Z48_12825 [Nitrospiraceae bacterium]|nr:hypothetical protein [Nitrospiraceae bacterium]
MGRLLADFRRFARDRGINGSCFLVGGSVRAILAGEKSPKDADIALKGNALKAARGFAEEAGATFVLLDERFGMARVVRGDEHLDISRFRGKGIEEDLSKRDITINAMAFPLTSRRLIDPLGGARDLMRGIVRVISEDNLAQDPLRILRCYRFSAAAGFRIERNSAAALKRLAPLLRKPAPERITEEFQKILSSQGAGRVLERMLKDGVLRVIMPGFRGANLIALKTLRRAWARPTPLAPPGMGRKWAIKKFHYSPEAFFPIELAVLASGTSGRAMGRFVLSKRQRQLIERLYHLRPRLKRLCKLRRLYKSGGLQEKYAGRAAATRLLRDAGDEIYAHLLFSCAFSIAEDEEEGEGFLEFSRSLLALYIKEVRPRLAKKQISGEDLKKEFNLEPSPFFKAVLDRVQMKWLLGEVKDRQGALLAAKKIIDRA